MFNHSVSIGALPKTLTKASISLILKKEKDPTECSSYRLISFLNTNVNILAKILAKRIETCLPSIISEDQIGFIRGWHLFSNVCHLLNNIGSPSKATKTEVVLALDVEKAFDRVEWRYLFKLRERFDFSKNFNFWVCLLYSLSQARVHTNSQYLSYFTQSRQGCPLSPLLFALLNFYP